MRKHLPALVFCLSILFLIGMIVTCFFIGNSIVHLRTDAVASARDFIWLTLSPYALVGFSAAGLICAYIHKGMQPVTVLTTLSAVLQNVFAVMCGVSFVLGFFVRFI